jgi:hypothetical protein
VVRATWCSVFVAVSEVLKAYFEVLVYGQGTELARYQLTKRFDQGASHYLLTSGLVYLIETLIQVCKLLMESASKAQRLCFSWINHQVKIKGYQMKSYSFISPSLV